MAGNHGIRRLGIFTVFLFLAIAGSWSRYRSWAHLPRAFPMTIPVPEGRRQGYGTTFPLTESQLSEKGKWVDGRIAGLDWTSVATVNGLAYGTESGTGRGDKSYDDSVALLTGVWGPDQTVEARVHSVNPSENVLEEVELRLRSSLAAHSSTGYEILFRCLKTSRAYASIVRWDGALGRFTYLAQSYGPQYGVADGDVVKAAIVGNMITGYVNGVQVLHAVDSTFSKGSPGIGFWMQRHSGIRGWLTTLNTKNTDFGFTSFAAWN